MEERKKLINEFQKWLDTNPNKNIIASECATIAERYTQQRVNEVLDKASKNVNEFKTNKSEDDFEKGWNSCIECINKTKSILKLKNNEK